MKSIIIFLIIVFSYECVASVGDTATTNLTPVILVPGLASSQIEIKINDLNSPLIPHWYCKPLPGSRWLSPNGWMLGWLNINYVTLEGDCWQHAISLQWDHVTKSARDRDLYTSRVAMGSGFGDTAPVETLDPYVPAPDVKVYSNFVNRFIKLSGYKRGENIFGAPYDFRYAPNMLGDYYTRLKWLVERAAKLNGDKKVALVCHSMGAGVCTYFLQHESQEWKDKYIKSFVSIGGPYGGSLYALQAFVSGYNLGAAIFNEKVLRFAERTFPSLAYLLPGASHVTKLKNGRKVPVWPDSLIDRMGTGYGVNDYQALFWDLDLQDGYDMYESVKNATSLEIHPGVPILCITGTGTPTPYKFGFLEENSFPDGGRVTYSESGDGTVSDRSARLCREFNREKYTFQEMHALGVTHVDLIKNDTIIDAVNAYLKYLL